MLPYRLRPPVYGGKLKRKKELEGISLDDRTRPNREGGPVERAVRADLFALLPSFNSKLEELLTVDSSSLSHKAPGLAFHAFKDVFSSNKVATLNRSAHQSGLVPSKCDRNAYSQMLYSVCLSMVQQSFRENLEWNNLDHAGTNGNFLHLCAFAVFTLYALYETNPLPKGPAPGSSKEEILDLLPIGQLDRENIRTTFRRAYRSPIRIDVEQYGYLIQLRELTNAGRCQCAASLAQRTISQQHDYTTWRCECWVGTDIGCVLDRILSSNMLDYCSYTGPCGLEGLAGHGEYKSIPSLSASKNDHQTDSHMVTTGPIKRNEPFQPSLDLKDHLRQYIADRSGIRLPANTSKMSLKDKRVRGVLESMFAKKVDYAAILGDPQVDEDNDPDVDEHKRMRICRHRRHVFFGNVESQDDEQLQKNTLEVQGFESSTGQAPNDFKVGKPADDVILPDSITSKHRAMLVAMVEELVERGAISTPIACQNKTPSVIGVVQRDDTSIIGHEIQSSTAGSSVANVGRSALNDLLARVVVEQTQPMTVDMRMEDLFLSQLDDDDDDLDNGQDDINAHFSDLSSDSDSEMNSIATSRVGQRALQELLLTTTSKGSAVVATARKDNNMSRSVPSIDNVKNDDDTEESTEDDEDEDSDTDHEIKSIATSQAGKKALQTLLLAAGKSKESSEDRPKRNGKSDGSPRRVTKQPLKSSIRLSHNANDKSLAVTSNEVASVSSRSKKDESSVASSRAGQRALQDLLAAANGKRAAPDKPIK